MKLSSAIFATLLIPMSTIGQHLETPPEGWAPMYGGGQESLPNLCVTGVDKAQAVSDTPTMTVRCNAEPPSFGGLYSDVTDPRFLGRSVRLRGMLRADGIRGSNDTAGIGSLWLLYVTPDGPVTNSLRDIGLRGTTEWKELEFIVDIPSTARTVMIGFWMQGHGQLWAKDIELTLVTADSK